MVSFGSTLSIPGGQTNRNGLSGKSFSIPKSSTIWGSVVEKKWSLMSPARDKRLQACLVEHLVE